jgi:phage shock protein A
MSILSRIMHLLRMRTHSALDTVEDPGQVMDYSYSKQVEQLQQLRRSIVDAVTNEKRLEMQQKEVEAKVNKLGAQARQALMANREDLAYLALQRKEDLVSQLNSYEQHIAQLKAQTEKLITLERNMSTRVETFRAQKEMVKAQYNTAQAQVKINETITGISQEMTEMDLAMQRAQDKVLTMQARANAMETLIEQGFPDAHSSDTLDRELRQITTGQHIEAQLQALKQQLQFDEQNGQQRQIKGPVTD